MNVRPLSEKNQSKTTTIVLKILPILPSVQLNSNQEPYHMHAVPLGSIFERSPHLAAAPTSLTQTDVSPVILKSIP